MVDNDTLTYYRTPPSFCVYIYRLIIEKHRYLPFLTCLWLTESSLVCAGYDCYPMLWRHDGSGNLTYINKLDHHKETKSVTRSIRYIKTFST